MNDRRALDTHSLSACFGNAIKSDETFVGDVVHLAGSFRVADDFHKGSGKVFNVTELGYLHARAGNGDGAAGSDTMEEPLFNLIVVTCRKSTQSNDI